MFIRIVLLIWTALNAYVIWRISTVPVVARYIGRWPMIIIGVVLWGSFLLPRFIDDTRAGAISRAFEIFGSIWLGVLFLLFCSFLVVDVVTLFGLVFKSALPAFRTGALVLGLLLSAIALVQGFRAPAVSNYEVTVKNLPSEYDGLVVAAISDLHVGAILGADWTAARVSQVNALKPDLIAVVGDIVEGHGNGQRESRIMSALDGLSAPLGVWGVTGNHEHYSRRAGVDAYQDAGIRMLHDERQELQPGLVLAGIDDPGGGVVTDTSGQIQKTLDSITGNPAIIFLSHRPQGAEEAAAHGVGLMLSGHTHGGQLWPFNYISRLFNPLMAGRYDINGMPIIVCRGTGTWGPRMRLWQRGEILRITLRSE